MFAWLNCNIARLACRGERQFIVDQQWEDFNLTVMIVLFDKVCVNIDHAVMAQLTVIIITLTSKVTYIYNMMMMIMLYIMK